MRVLRMRLDDSTLVPPNIRFFEGNIEITFNGGLTWVISPENDPRYGVQFLAPALTGEDARCDAAYRMTEIIRAQVDAALDAAEAVGLATTIIGILTVLIPINPIVALVTALAAGLLVIGAIVLDAAFTEERYEQIQCIFYDNIGEDGQVSAEQLEAILVDFETEFAGSIAADVCVSVVFVMGQNGLSNAGSLTEGGGNCEDCGEWCYHWDFSADDGDFTALSGRANYTSSEGWTEWGFYVPTLVASYIQIERAFEPSSLTYFKFEYETLTANFTPTGSGVFAEVVTTGGTYNTGTFAIDYLNPAASYAWSGDYNNVTAVRFYIQANQSPGDFGSPVDMRVTSAEFSGTGANPIGEDNCEE